MQSHLCISFLFDSTKSIVYNKLQWRCIKESLYDRFVLKGDHQHFYHIHLAKKKVNSHNCQWPWYIYLWLCFGWCCGRHITLNKCNKECWQFVGACFFPVQLLQCQEKKQLLHHFLMFLFLGIMAHDMQLINILSSLSLIRVLDLHYCKKSCNLVLSIFFRKHTHTKPWLKSIFWSFYKGDVIIIIYYNSLTEGWSPLFAFCCQSGYSKQRFECRLGRTQQIVAAVD